MNTIVIRRGFSDIIANIATMYTAIPALVVGYSWIFLFEWSAV